MEEKSLWQKVVELSQYMDKMGYDVPNWNFLDEKTIAFSQRDESIDAQVDVLKHLLETRWTFCTRDEISQKYYRYTFTDNQSNYFSYYCRADSDYLHAVSQFWCDEPKEGNWIDYLTTQERNYYEEDR